MQTCQGNLTSTIENILPVEEQFPDLWHLGEHNKQRLGMYCTWLLYQYLTYLQSYRSIVSPYTLSAPQQVMICIERGFQRLKRNASFAITGLIVNSAMALIIGSVFYNLSDDTASFYSRGVLLFFSIFLNAFASALEVEGPTI